MIWYLGTFVKSDSTGRIFMKIFKKGDICVTFRIIKAN